MDPPGLLRWGAAALPAPSEMRGSFEAIELHGDFWDPTADRFE